MPHIAEKISLAVNKPGNSFCRKTNYCDICHFGGLMGIGTSGRSANLSGQRITGIQRAGVKSIETKFR